MEIVTRAQRMTLLSREARARGERIGFVPTMGALHEGHRSLMRVARRECEVLVASVFVNPTQFGPGEDFEQYPRPIDADLAACRDEGVQVPKPVHLLAAYHGYERGGPAGRVQGLGELHGHDGEGYGKRGCKPGRAPRHVIKEDPAQAGDDMPANEVPGLGERALYSAVHERGGRTERAY